MIKTPQDCQTIHDVREAIDVLDADLIARLANRRRYIDRAAQIKPAAGLPARITSRVEEVVSNVRRHCEEQGFDADLAERMWRDMIECAIAREESAMATEGKGNAE